MVISIDLKPLSEETIAQMGYNNHDLWLVKIGSVVFGPYETESLKHYVHDNEHLFETALASRADETEWKSFWEHTQFQRRKPQVIQGEVYEGPFWIIDHGLKVGPFSLREIDKKLEMEILSMTDHISIDEGHTWIKVFQIEGFDRRSLNPDDLPIAPYENSFQKAKLALVEKLETQHANPLDGLAEMAWQGQNSAKVLQFKIEEMTLTQQQQTEVSAAVKWAVPTAAALILTVVTSGYFLFSSDDVDLADVDVKEETLFYQKKMAIKESPVTPRAVIPSARQPSIRKPASVGYTQPSPTPSRQESASRYPTHIETHEEHYQEPAYQDRDALEGPVSDMERPAEEHSLVDNFGPRDDQSLDAAMTGPEPVIENPVPDQPVVEEVSDF
ncbi:MAG: hypothetical protein ACLGHN_06930 [Bacteriovoracia bacterium]